MNMIFGGQFSSRLNMNLREEKGYTYGAHSGWDWRVHERGPYVASASVQTAVTAPALTEFLKDFDGMVGDATGGRKGSSTSARNTSPAATWAVLRRPRRSPGNWRRSSPTTCPTTTSTRSCRAFAVTADDVMRVAKKYLALDRLSVIVVGDRAAIEPELRKLPIGKDLAVYEFDDAFRLRPVGTKQGSMP